MKIAIILACLAIGSAATEMPKASAQTFPADNLTSYGKTAWQQSAEPVRPGVPGKTPFWNGHARRYIYAPAFDFKEVADASKYHFVVRSDKTSETLTFDSEHPYAPLSPVWTKLPVGGFEVTATAVAADGSTLSIAGEKKGWRAAPFNGIYHQPPVLPLPDSATLALKNLLHKDYVNYWLEHKTPDPEYNLYRYPSKIMGALVIGAVTQARLTSGTEEAQRSEKLARIVADYMLTIRFPKGSKYENMVPTYYGIHIKKEKPQKPHMIYENHMLPMGADAGNAFLDLYDLVGDDKYLDAAKQIAETYVKTQGPDGTWPLFANFESGEMVKDVVAIPTAMINYFDRLRQDYDMKGLDEPTKKALDWVMANPVKTFEWHGQFEDISPRADYVNQSREQACELAMYLFRNKQNLPLAEELVRFSEDQFVIWEQPRPVDPGKGKAKGKNSKTWITPSVEEQYVFWYPVGRAAGIMIETFKEAYLATGKEIYMAKARSIANSFPEVQKVYKGDYHTFFTPYSWNFWLNSVVYPAKVLMNLDSGK